MASNIKEISKFSEDAIQLAINKLPEKEQDSMKTNLSTVLSYLGKKEAKKPSTIVKVLDEEIFKKQIVPKIQQRIQEMEQLELQNKLQITVDFDVITDFNEMTQEEIMSAHSKIVALENDLKTMTIISQFIRGKLYIFLGEKISQSRGNLRQTVEEKLRVNYRTFLRYAALANIILLYPRLVLCELSFSQLILHKNRMIKFFASTEGQHLRDQLSFSVEMKAQGRKIIIERCEVDVMKMNFVTHPDWDFRDFHEKVNLPEEKVKKWMASTSEACREADEEALLRDDFKGIDL